MKKLAFFILITAVLISNVFSQVLTSDDHCSTFMLKHGSELIFGHNLDMPYSIPGLIVINKRNIYKEGVSWRELTSLTTESSPRITWTSKYGSVTFNPMGVEFPDGGMNEKGLAIWEMTLQGTQFPENESLSKLFMMQWMQYQLDNHESVEQVIKSASEIILDGWAWHFFTADKDGNCAAIEFINGKPVIHTGDDLPVTALCNSQYKMEIDRLKDYKDFGGNRTISLSNRYQQRFVHAAYMIKNYKSDDSKSIIDYGFDILKQLNRGGTQWSIICDMKNLDVYLLTSVGTNIRHFSLNSFDLSSKDPVKILDINSDLQGDITGKFENYSFEANRDFLRTGFDQLISHSPDFENFITSNGIITKDFMINRMASYHDSTIYKK